MTLSIRMKHNGPSMYAADFVRCYGTPNAQVVLHLEPGEEGDVHVWAGDGSLTVVETLPKNVAKPAPDPNKPDWVDPQFQKDLARG